MIGARTALVLLVMAGCEAGFSSPGECLVVTLSNVDDNSSAGVKGTSSNGNVIVEVSQGTLRGKKVQSRVTGEEYYSFQGIPYAQPPVGELRFKAPREPSSWKGIRDATTEGAICPQYDNGPIRGSEDCLFLNVYSPQLPGARSPQLLPVMVWIHGGGHFGSGNAVRTGPDFLVSKHVIVVTLNYRLGVLGFLGIQSPQVSVNNGLKDQVAALKWVQANIAQFGGDKDRVTIFGESYGASCVEFLMLSPVTKGLFHRAISQSGNAIDRWAYIEPSRARARAFILGEVLGLKNQNAEELVELLKQAPVETLLPNQERAYTIDDRLQSADIAFLPTWEEGGAKGAAAFLPDDPVKILRSGKYQHVPYMTGFNSAEAKFAFLGFLSNDSLWELLNQNTERFIPPQLHVPLGSQQSRQLAANIKKLYFGDVTPTKKNIQDLVTLGTDAWFVQGVRRTVKLRLRTSSAPVYVYQFSYVGSLSISEYCKFGYSWKAAAHADELGYMFWLHRLKARPDARDIAARDRITTMWTNFAKTGNPSLPLQARWKPVSPTSQKYLDIDEVLSIRDLNFLRFDKFAFWDKIYEAIDG